MVRDRSTNTHAGLAIVTMTSVTIDQIAAAAGGNAIGFDSNQRAFEPTETNPIVSIDSRTIAPGQLFWAINGDNFDGHDFVQTAVDRGADGVVVQRGNGHTGPRIEVEDTLEALSRFSRWYREQQEALLIGITGSYGKTTTRTMVHSVLSAAFSGCQSPKNFNNHFGVPLSLLQIKAHHDFAVLEFGASAVGEISQLSQLAGPEIGVITGIGPAHLDGFGSEENIVQAKGELLETIPRTGFAVLAADDSRVASMAARCEGRVITTGEQHHHDFTARSINVNRDGIRFSCDGHNYRLRAAARHFLTSALAAIAIGREIGMSPADIQSGLESFTPVSGRCETKQIGSWTVIDDTYNSNPSSMTAACRTLRDWKTDNNRVLVTGDMLELGNGDVAYHRKLGETAAKSGVQRLLALGQYADVVANAAIEAGMPPHQVAEAEHIEILHTVMECWLEPGDVVLVKGSRGMRMERVVQRLESLANEATAITNLHCSV